MSDEIRMWAVVGLILAIFMAVLTIIILATEPHHETWAG